MGKEIDADSQEEERIAELKVSQDQGESWHRRRVNFGVGLDESGLQLGEIFQMQGEQYEVLMGGGEMKKLKGPLGKKKTVKRY